MQATATKTGADKAADTLAGRLRAAGWDVRVNRNEHPVQRYRNGDVMLCAKRQVSLHAAGPSSAGRPYIAAFWFAERGDGTAEPVTKFHDADIDIGDFRRNLNSEAELGVWADALIAVSAAVET